MYVDLYRPWPGWVVTGNEEIAHKFGAQIGTYRGHADRDPGHDMSGDLAADFFLYVNTKDKHDAVLAWFKTNAVRLGATYIITWRRIWSVARAAEGVRVYNGSDPHTGHIHISYGTTPPEGEDMAITDADAVKVAKATLRQDNEIENVWKKPGDENLYVSTRSAFEELGRDVNRVQARLVNVDAELDAIRASLEQILLLIAPAELAAPPEVPPAP